MSQPLFKDISGGSNTGFSIVTNMQAHIITGTLDPNTSEVVLLIDDQQINSENLNMYLWWDTTDISQPKFTIPNINAMPEGLIIPPGTSTKISIASKIGGTLTSYSTALISVKATQDFDYSYDAPTGISLQRYSDSVDIKWSDVGPVNLMGYNVYASTGPGGTGSGYLRLNRDIISVDSPTETISEPVELGSGSFTFASENMNLSARIRVDAIDSITRAQSVEHIGFEKDYELLGFRDFQTEYKFSALRVRREYTFNHNRFNGVARGTLNQDTFSSIPGETPLYYVVTYLYNNYGTNEWFESPYSVEMVGLPLPQINDVRGLSIRSDSQVVQDYINEIIRVSPDLSLIPGSTVREVHIEPFANEIQKAYFLMDFVHRSGSFEALLNIDDPERTGSSVPVGNSSYKTSLKASLGISDDTAVQLMVNQAFENLASNYGVTRRGFGAATVLQTFYTNIRPTRDLFVTPNTAVVAPGSPSSPRFLTSGLSTMRLANIDSYYNPTKRRYEMKVQMNAEFGGSRGNLPAGSINVVASGAAGLMTENEFAAFGGTDISSNLELAETCLRKLSSVDSGSSGGYEAAVKSVPNVQDYRIVSAGSPYMHRDYDHDSHMHMGGKVDIYVKGKVLRPITEKYAFLFRINESERFIITSKSDIGMNLMSVDPSLNINNPIEKVYSLTNRNTGEEIPLGIVSYVDFNLVSITGNFSNLPYDSYIVGKYRYKTRNSIELNVQPVESITSISGEASGELNPQTGYQLYEWQDPSVDGYSTSSSEYVQIIQENGIPTGESVAVADEIHVMIGSIEEPLLSVGVDPDSIIVRYLDNNLNEILCTEGVDYDVVVGDNRNPTRIIRKEGGQIKNGQSVFVSYIHQENFIVNYNVNDLVRRVQEKVDSTKHITADVVVKQAVENPLSIQAVVQLSPNANQDEVDRNIRTNYSRMISRKGIGEDIHVSDVIAVIDNTSGVDFVIQPFGKMTLKDGSLRVRESISSVYTYVDQLTPKNNSCAVYMLNEMLPYSTIDNGATDNLFSGVYQNEELLPLIRDDVRLIHDYPKASFISGKDGAEFDGLTDFQTLYDRGFLTESARRQERARLTGNRVFISIPSNENKTPSDFKYTVTYHVFNDTSVKDVYVSDIEYLAPGDLTITYRKA